MESGERHPDGDPSGDGEQPPAPDPRGFPESASSRDVDTPFPTDPTPVTPTDPTPVTPTSPRSNDETRAGSTPPLRQWKQFTLLEEVGRGGFGVVYKAWDPGLSCERALKIIDRSRLPELSLEDWLGEGRMLAKIRHPNVVTVHGVEVLDNEIGLCMEFIHGETLADRLVRDGPSGPNNAIRTGMILCDALAAVHGAGLVHRDLKASNVMRERGGRIVLMDFGAGRERLTEPGGQSRLIGTPACMAPEVLRGEPATPASDIYSLGVLLFYLVTKKYPVPGAEFVDVCLAHDKGVRRRVAEFRKDLPSAFVDVIESALDREPASRPKSAAEFKQALLKARETHSGLIPVPPVPVPDPVVDDDVNWASPVPVPPSLLRRVAVTVAAIAAIVGICGALGFVTTLEFNNVLGRSGAFAEESPLVVFVSGVRALLGPAIYVSVLILLFSTAVLGAKLADRFVPRFHARMVRATGAVTDWGTRHTIDDPDLLMRGLAVVSLLALAVTLYVCLPIIGALASPINTGAPEVLGRLNLDEHIMPVLYRRVLELNLVLLAIGMLAIRRFGFRRRATISASAWVSAIIAGALVLLFLAGPWRIIFASKFRQAQLGGEQCFVIGESATELLLHCPARNPPRNTVAGKNAPELKVSAAPISELFASYSADGSESR